MIQVQVNNSPKIQCKIFTLNIFKNVVLMVDNMKGVTEKVEILHRGQSDPALQKTSNNFFLSLVPFLVQMGAQGQISLMQFLKWGIEP